MTIVYGRRGCGKTRRLIKWSAKTGGWIYTNTKEGKKFIEYQIAEMNLTGKAHVFNKYDISMHKNPPAGTEISIDNVDYVLEDIFNHYIIKEATLARKDIKRLRGGIKEHDDEL